MTTNPQPVPYEPPRIERTLDAEDLAREVKYAGDITLIGDSDQ